MNRYRVKFERSLSQEQTVYLESEHSIEVIIDWFENDGISLRYHPGKKEIPISGDLLQKELTEEGWESTGDNSNEP